MASQTTATTQKLTREQIAAIIGPNPRAIKAFELLLDDVVNTLPEAIDQVQLSTLFSLHGADGSKGAAQHSMQIAIEVQTLLTACQRLAGDVNALRDQVDLLRIELHETRSRFASSISRLQATCNDALTLTTGV